MAGNFGVYELKYVKGHVEVYVNGEFRVSADSLSEAFREMEESEDE